MNKISAEHWREVFALLDTALDLPPAERPAWLESLVQSSPTVIHALRSLLARRTADGFLENLPQFTGDPAAAPNPGAESVDVGSTVGPYRLLRRLGRGGMSSVWMAARIDGMLTRRVAIKLPHVSWAVPEAAQRMARERELLGSLEHPNIARLYDAGTGDDGRPFLALEYVDGLALDEYCDVRGADVAQRVALLLQTARAIAYAHSRAIIHRDLKPANILVDAAGQARLLDFGIGKLLEIGTAAGNETQFGNRLFTPDYASPEQLRGIPVTPGTDVYSLGVVMYQSLCGQLPGGRAAGEDIPPPSRMCADPVRAQALRGDLDAIVLTALKESLAERFASMEAFARDLDRYLHGEPVLARRDSLGYRLRKFAARNRQLVVAVTLAVALTLLLSVAFYLRQANLHDAAADTIAQRSVPDAAPSDLTAYQEYLGARSLMLRPSEANLREIIRLAENVTKREPAFAPGHALLAGANVLFLDVGYPRPGALLLAEPEARRALALAPNLPGAHATLGSIEAHRGHWLSAETHFERAIDHDDHTGRIHARRAQMILWSLGRLQEASREFLAEFRLSPAHARGAMQVAQSFSMLGRDAEARRYVDTALSLGWSPEERDVRELYARAAWRAGRHEQALAFQRLALPEAARGARTFDALMFSITGFAMSGDLDHAYAEAGKWAQLVASSGLSGIPYNAGFWLPELRAFRADPRFHDLAARLGMLEYWRKYGAPDGCVLDTRLRCE